MIACTNAKLDDLPESLIVQVLAFLDNNINVVTASRKLFSAFKNEQRWRDVYMTWWKSEHIAGKTFYCIRNKSWRYDHFENLRHLSEWFNAKATFKSIRKLGRHVYNGCLQKSGLYLISNRKIIYVPFLKNSPYQETQSRLDAINDEFRGAIESSHSDHSTYCKCEFFIISNSQLFHLALSSSLRLTKICDINNEVMVGAISAHQSRYSILFSDRDSNNLRMCTFKKSDEDQMYRVVDRNALGAPCSWKMHQNGIIAAFDSGYVSFHNVDGTTAWSCHVAPSITDIFYTKNADYIIVFSINDESCSIVSSQDGSIVAKHSIHYENLTLTQAVFGGHNSDTIFLIYRPASQQKSHATVYVRMSVCLDTHNVKLVVFFKSIFEHRELIIGDGFILLQFPKVIHLINGKTLSIVDTFDFKCKKNSKIVDLYVTDSSIHFAIIKNNDLVYTFKREKLAPVKIKQWRSPQKRNANNSNPRRKQSEIISEDITDFYDERQRSHLLQRKVDAYNIPDFTEDELIKLAMQMSLDGQK